MLILTIVILLIAGTISFFYFSYNNAESITWFWLDQTGVLPLAWVPYLIGLLVVLLITAWLLAFLFSFPKRLRRRAQVRNMNKSRTTLDKGLMEILSERFGTFLITALEFLALLFIIVIGAIALWVLIAYIVDVTQIRHTVRRNIGTWEGHSRTGVSFSRWRSRSNLRRAKTRRAPQRLRPDDSALRPRRGLHRAWLYR